MQSLWGYLKDTCLTAQDRFKKYLDYFKIECRDTEERVL